MCVRERNYCAQRGETRESNNSAAENAAKLLRRAQREVRKESNSDEPLTTTSLSEKE